MQFRNSSDFACEEWQDIKDACIERSGGRCEFCGLPLYGNGTGHHRWYPDGPDSPSNIMIVHHACHRAIHYGGRIRVTPDSLAARGDSGKGNSLLWRVYLEQMSQPHPN